MAHSNQKTKNFNIFVFVVSILLIIVFITTILLQGTNVALLNPKGLIAGEEHRLLLYCTIVLLAIGIPTLILFYFVAWRYRESNKKAGHAQETKNGKQLVFLIWGLPTLIMIILAVIMWPATHRLAPKEALASSVKPLHIQVVALRWKWLFIYPEQNIAAVNYLQIPTNTPVQLELTADEAPMSSFWIPQLAGQLYAMTGHNNILNLLASHEGDYDGRSAEINGDGFAGMTFKAQAVSQESFETWVQDTKSYPRALSTQEYAQLLEPSENNKVALYSQADPALFANVLIKYNGSHNSHEGQ